MYTILERFSKFEIKKIEKYIFHLSEQIARLKQIHKKSLSKGLLS